MFANLAAVLCATELEVFKINLNLFWYFYDRCKLINNTRCTVDFYYFFLFFFAERDLRPNLMII